MFNSRENAALIRSLGVRITKSTTSSYSNCQDLGTGDPVVTQMSQMRDSKLPSVLPSYLPADNLFLGLMHVWLYWATTEYHTGQPTDSMSVEDELMHSASSIGYYDDKTTL
ncbi:hypothetical protein FPSE_06513 [Fusarium pseudograminearum CS3096]|uniref:Uncharacterized protein n=1 Tax=Fusarium pseudograminearum (strain CS3096) TaxID=1028729 RepID=K3VJ74_FUSPC|nr:hypothetical protein FPSE_06513 [Fusarium pseudograminearum CS3096]EKJ73248.1 hypothetical protein FPSE_06513 [Fusarium pseudograminearum CS3096]